MGIENILSPEEMFLSVDDITGTIGEWFEYDTSDIPEEALMYLRKAYFICADALDRK